MGVVVGLGVGVGLLLVWSAFVSPRGESRPPALSRRIEQTLASAGMGHLRAGTVGGASLGAACVAFLLMLLVSGAATVAAAFAAMAAYLPWSVVRARARRRQEAFAQVWPEAVDNLASAVRAGMSLPDALAGLAHSGPPPLRPAFADFAADYQLSGRFSDALDRLKERLADPVGDRMVEGLRVAREVGGGDLGRLLRNLSHFLRDDARTRSELLARQAWTVTGARLAVAAPWAVLLLMSFQSGAVDSYATPAGALVLLVGGLGCIGAYATMTRIGRLPAERRILA